MPHPFWSKERKLAPRGIIRPVFPSLCISAQNRKNSFPLHRHPSYEMIVVERGAYLCRLNGAELSLKPGRALIVKPGDWHEDACIPPLRYQGIRFQVEWPSLKERLSLFAAGARPADQVFAAPPSLFDSLFAKIKEESKRKDASSPLILAALMEELFWRMIRALRQGALSLPFQQSAEEQSLGQRMERLFQSRQGGILSVGEMARELGLAERPLDRRCRLLFGESPARCFTRFKVGQATALLRQTATPIKEISASLGFDNPYHFSRVFHRLTGRAPSSARRKKKSTPRLNRDSA